MGVLLSLLMLMQFVVVPASAAQKLSTPTGFAVVNDWGDMIIDYSDSTPAQYVDHYLVHFYAIGGGVVYDPGYRGMYDYSDLYIEDLYQDFEDIKDEFERELTSALDRLFDPNEPFTQVEDANACKMCDFKKICRR